MDTSWKNRDLQFKMEIGYMFLHTMLVGVNLNSAKATEHLRELYPNGFHGIIPIELRHYLVWQRRVPPRFEEEWHDAR